MSGIEVSNPPRYVWNPDSGVVERFEIDFRYDQDRFDTNGGLELPAETRGSRNVSGTLESVYTINVSGGSFRVPGGGDYQTPPEGYVINVARDQPVTLAYDLETDQYGFDVVSQVGRWNVATGVFDVYRFNFNADFGETRTLGVSALGPTGNLAAKQSTDGQTIVRLVTAGSRVQSATSVAGIVAAADYDPGTHAEVLCLYQAIFGRCVPLGRREP